MTQAQEEPPFEKEVVRLPDGRLLTFYRFPDVPKEPPPRGERPAGTAPPPGKER
jgi:hypothetical protein